ncbi:DUF4012 domain-containing protein [Plantactinospora siamensis]|uniref:DUF4012 domain-containing protein n=1 Tax=Plantactinospora siamensis TaxID=555372 RepID=A0ABV6P2J3_9ACTN
MGALLLLTAGWVGGRVWQTRGHLTNAVGLARALAEQIAAENVPQARRTLDALQQQAAAARTSSTDPVWWAAAHTPYAGNNLAATHEIAAAVDDIARQVFPRLLAVDVASLAPRNGRIDPSALRRASAPLGEADVAAQRVRAAFNPPTAHLVRPVGDAVGQLRSTLDQLARLTSAAHRAGTLLPRLLGGAGQRSYLLAFQNPAELRATGGMIGAYAVIRVANGRIRITDQGSATGMGLFALPVDRDLRNLYGDLPGIYAADVNLSPDFSAAAARYREMYRLRTGESVDGVLATDPVALAYLLRAVGPVTVPGGGTLTSATAVRTLLADVYRRATPVQQDEYYARSAKAVFDALLTRPVNLPAVATALGSVLAERRLLFWSAHPDEQAEVVDTRLGGVLPDQETRPTVGVFLNDGTGAKLGYYLVGTAKLTAGACEPGGRREYAVRVTLASTAPHTGLSESVLGFGFTKASAIPGYTARTLVAVYSPAGGSVLSAALDGRRVAIGSGRERRRQVGIAAVDLRPGQSRTLEVTVSAPPTATGRPDLWLTPGVTPWTTSISSAPPCNQ